MKEKSSLNFDKARLTFVSPELHSVTQTKGSILIFNQLGEKLLDPILSKQQMRTCFPLSTLKPGPCFLGTLRNPVRYEKRYDNMIRARLEPKKASCASMRTFSENNSDLNSNYSVRLNLCVLPAFSYSRVAFTHNLVSNFHKMKYVGIQFLLVKDFFRIGSVDIYF